MGEQEIDPSIPGIFTIIDKTKIQDTVEIEEIKLKNEDSNDREKWGNSIEFLMSCIAFSVGLGNVWRFPYTAYENGGGAFVVAYLIVLFLVGKPFYYMESLIGQFTSRSCVKMWSISPAFRGIGYGVTISVFLVESYYAGLMALIFFYLIISFQSPLPWSICQSDWGDECFNQSAINNNTFNNISINTKSSSELFFIKLVLHESKINNGLGNPSWKLVVSLFISWLIIYIILFKGVKSSGKASYFLALFPYIIMISLFIRAITLDGAIDGIIYLFKPDWLKMTDPSVWYAAVTQSFFSLGVCFGGVTMYSSYNKFNHNITRDCMIISYLDLCTSLISGATIFGILGNLTHELGIDDFKSVVRSGTGLAFISYPEALAKFTVVPSMFAVLFFLMLFVLGVGTSVALCAVVISVIKDQFSTVEQWRIVTGVSITGFFIGIIYCTPGGQYMINLVDHFSGTFPILFLASFEIIAISWVYGIDNFLDDMEFMLGKRPNIFWRLCWSFFTPIILFSILFYFIFTLTPLKYNNEFYPTSAYVAGWSLLVLGITPFIFIFIKTILKSKQKSKTFKPSSDWGPIDIETRKNWETFKENRNRERTAALKKNKLKVILCDRY